MAYINTSSKNQIDKTSRTVVNQIHKAIMSKDSDTAKKLLYWLNTWSENYLIKEDTFDYDKLIAYKRGMIIKADFGFNVGSEQGGLHYALVIENDNKKSNRTIMVIPLGSLDDDKTPNDINKTNEVFLGYSLFKDEISKIQNKIHKKQKLITHLNSKNQNTLRVEKDLTKLEKKLEDYKKGSIALLNQLCALSKIRIHYPINSGDELYSFRLNPKKMTEIEIKLKSLYLTKESLTIQK